MCIPLSSFQNQYKVGNLYKSLFINPKINICNFELFCPACSQFFFNCKNRWLSLFIVHARGRDVKSQGEEETKGEWRGEMDRGEDRDLLSSAVFDGSHDRLHNKRLMANDSKRKRDGKRWGRGRGGSLPFRRFQPYRCHVREGPQDNKIVCHLEPQTHRNHSARLEEMIWTLRFFSQKVKPWLADTFTT